jgi:hypothetical protein
MNLKNSFLNIYYLNMSNNSNNSKLDQYKEIIKSYIAEKFNADKLVESYNQKLIDLVKRVNNAMMEKCKKEYENLTKHAKIDKQANGTPDIVFNKGEEEQGKEALVIFTGCARDYSNIIIDLKALDDINEYLMNEQLNSCSSECIKGTHVENCLKKCVDFTFNYTFKSVNNIMSQNVDIANEQLNKFI